MIPVITRANFEVDYLYHHLSLSGIAILIDKDRQWTSFDVVAKLRRLLSIRRIGHAGTLDPSATGLLIVCAGKATKYISHFQDMTKEYQVEIKLGARTASDDAETPEYAHQSIDHLSDADITGVISQFVGTILQVPPAYSAVRFHGRRLYDIARRGESLPTLSPRQVTIYAIKNIQIERPYARFTIQCSRGTYVRALARDIGMALGVGAYVTALRRTAIGEYRVEQAWRIHELAELLRPSHYANISFNS
ncbi:MAG: tRNA pseudouridine(55) synthase TruB [Bacteroidota bacterium]|nr:tRNA pseudouridine(55) synthase TruB [Candidatus Kapabacteria bacterium]MCS7302992.1 tRNA pseudouridine(55) synthase TruB [Candidatus Kapabacteria bacterium]MCX7937379.1 tRNA pseudouridine(55) synthase TruB [Chlorobiota bacterium]MDW8074500.1 tRNA pseudouridine(55) synthase TruB [Bacteroidota bacterium]MDW8271024.1 tRNA pseudouridine(55) synthase TruB [Bacteroidota bacterium]